MAQSANLRWSWELEVTMAFAFEDVAAVSIVLADARSAVSETAIRDEHDFRVGVVKLACCFRGSSSL
jgi:hypothetical protein